MFTRVSSFALRLVGAVQCASGSLHIETVAMIRGCSPTQELSSLLD